MLPDDGADEERKPQLIASAAAPNGGAGSSSSSGSNNGSGSTNGSSSSATQQQSSSASASSTPSRALTHRRRRDDQEEGDGGGGRGDDQNNNNHPDGDAPWPPAEELRYWAVTRTLRLAVLVAFLGLVQALLSAEAIFWLVLGLASTSSLAALGYTRVRERGLLEYLPDSTRRLLLETSLLDWLLDTSMADRMKPYAVLTFGGLNAEERAFLVGSLPREQQRALVAPGLMHALPPVRELGWVGLDGVWLRLVDIDGM